MMIARPEDLRLIHAESFTVATRGKGLVDVTERVASVVARSGFRAGLANVFIRHTSASLLITENADPAVLRDLELWLSALAPEGTHYEHDDEGPDDMPGHLRSAVTRTSEQIPFADAKLQLGTWQAVYIWEHRTAPKQRELVVTVLGT